MFFLQQFSVNGTKRSPRAPQGVRRARLFHFLLLLRAAIPAVGAVVLASVFSPVYGQQPDSSQVFPLDSIVVTADVVGTLGLDQLTETGSHLGLSPLETPASVTVLSGAMMRARGYMKVADAVQSVPGVVAGNHPTAPGVFSMRGFSVSQVTILRDGLWIGPSAMVTRPQNTFNLDRIEILKGPASVLSGQGTVAGTINTVSKKASPLRPRSVGALAEYGRYGTYHMGVGSGGPLGSSAWYRVDVSRHGSEGYVERTDVASTNVTGNLLWQPIANLSLRVTVDYLDDQVGGYFGTPLVPTGEAREPMTDVVQTGSTPFWRTVELRY